MAGLGNAADIYDRNRKEEAKLRHFIRADIEKNRVVINEAIALNIYMGNNVMILEDQYKSGYECKECSGLGEYEINCSKCEGSGEYLEAMRPTEDEPISCGKCNGTGKKTVTCKACNGKGALIEIPENARHRPTSGTIVAVGPDVQYLQLGDRVAYSGHTGHLLPFKGNNRLRIMTEREPFCKISDLETATKESINNIEFIDKDNPYDLQ